MPGADATPHPHVLAPGNYDGVHRGHQVLLARASAYAKTHGLRTRVLTFDPHPMALLAPDRAPTPLTTPQRRRELLLGRGVDSVQIARFDQAFASQSPTEFVEWLLGQGTSAFVVGHDFHFGKRAAGDVALLARMGQMHGFAVMIEGPVEFAGQRVSSSAVRTALEAGDVGLAADLLDRYHDLSGEVVSGDRRGRQLGFPTLNVAAEAVLRPRDGVYAVAVRVLDAGASTTPLPGVANVGTRPTFAAGRSLEVHLLDFQGDLYGSTVRVAFVRHLRAERAFDGVEALKRQITADCGAARAALDDVDQGKLAWI